MLSLLRRFRKFCCFDLSVICSKKKTWMGLPSWPMNPSQNFESVSTIIRTPQKYFFQRKGHQSWTKSEVPARIWMKLLHIHAAIPNHLCFDFNDSLSIVTTWENLPARNGITNKVQSQGEGQGTRNQQNGKCGACEALVSVMIRARDRS